MSDGRIFSELSDDIKEKLARYVELLLSWVGKVRLTGAQDADGLWEHVIDCLDALPHLPESGKVIDVGTGGGLPGVAWALCRPDLSFTLLDSTRKKCAAVEQMCTELKLRNVRVLWGRAEEYARGDAAASFDMAAARAVTAAPELIKLLAPLVRPGGCAFAFKGAKFAEELEGCSKALLSRLRLAQPECVCYNQERDGWFIIWKKLGKR